MELPFIPIELVDIILTFMLGQLCIAPLPDGRTLQYTVSSISRHWRKRNQPYIRALIAKSILREQLEKERRWMARENFHKQPTWIAKRLAWLDETTGQLRDAWVKRILGKLRGH
jgi:hypothetical protein